MQRPFRSFLIVLISAIFNTIAIAGLTDPGAGGPSRECLRSANSFDGTKSFYSTDSLIASVVSCVNEDTVRAFMLGLQSFKTRNAYLPARDSAALWIKQKFLNMGYTDVALDSFYAPQGWQRNVIATLPGYSEPNTLCVIGGHYDSHSPDQSNAPGADDNASGTTAALEIARILKMKNYKPEKTIKFIAFADEEYMLFGGQYGSLDFVQKCQAGGAKISLMINNDMISNSTLPPAQAKVEVNYYEGFEDLLPFAQTIVSNYTTLTPIKGSLNQPSDSYPFWINGYPAVYFEESEFSPFYHTSGDTVGNCNIPYCAEVIKAACATLLTACKQPGRVEGYKLENIGDGVSLLASWIRSDDSAISGYKIRVGDTTGLYDTAYFTSDTMFIIPSLTDGKTYYVSVAAVTHYGWESTLVERSCLAASVPACPGSFTVYPRPAVINFEWNRVYDLDLKGYNLYRSQSASGPRIKLNQIPIVNTFYTDENCTAGIYYYYYLKSVDNSGLESQETEQRARLFSLDQGICVINESKGGDGSPLNPTTQQFDSFYREALDGFRFDTLNVNSYSKVTLSDLGAYSSIIWHGNDPSDLTLPYFSAEALKRFMDSGGKILFTVYRPAVGFMNYSSATAVFQSGEFIYDYLRIQQSKSALQSRFIGAKAGPAGNLPLYVDTTKTSSSQNYHLANISTISPAPAGSSILLFDSRYDSLSAQGNLKGLPVGVEYLGGPYRVVTLSFPLYYIKAEQAKAFIRHVLLNLFGEPLKIEKSVNLEAENFLLLQNYPNPFNPSTMVNFYLPGKCNVTLVVYNQLGQRVKELFSGWAERGWHEYVFETGNLSSGVYFGVLTAGDNRAVRKMILIR